MKQNYRTTLLDPLKPSSKPFLTPRGCVYPWSLWLRSLEIPRPDRSSLKMQSPGMTKTPWPWPGPCSAGHIPCFHIAFTSCVDFEDHGCYKDQSLGFIGTLEDAKIFPRNIHCRHASAPQAAQIMRAARYGRRNSVTGGGMSRRRASQRCGETLLIQIRL